MCNKLQARPLLTRALEEGKYDELVDPKLENNYNPNEMTRMVASAAASIRHSGKKRPKMSQVWGFKINPRTKRKYLIYPVYVSLLSQCMRLTWL